jgi:ketosteroid isomerase-like protein
MKNHRKLLLLAALAFVYFFVNSQPKKTNENTLLEEAKKAIAASNAIYFESFVKNDASIFVERYAEDACIMAPNAPAMCGREAASAFFKTAYEEFGLKNGKFITTAVYGDGKEYVTEEGLWQSFNGGGDLIDDGKFLVLWKKTSTGWKMFRDSFSSNRSVENKDQ